VAHVFLIPACIFAFVGLHVFLFRKAGSAGPVSEDPIEPRQKTEQFYPKQVIMDIVFATVLMGTLGLLSYLVPVGLGPRANPADTSFLPRPEWYYLPVFQWLKYWNGGLSVIGIIVIPGIIALLLVLLPFLDRRKERRPWKRPVASFSFAIVFCALLFLGWQSGYEDSHDPSIATQIHRQDSTAAAFMDAPFVPVMIGGANANAMQQLSPEAAAGKKVFLDNSCDQCHGENGEGTDKAPKLLGVADKLGPDTLVNRLVHPTKKADDAGMDPVDVSDSEFSELVAYLKSLK
ncbi:MAG: c-type cytochrome, partial [Candidatus Kapaibacterium sp.]